MWRLWHSPAARTCCRACCHLQALPMGSRITLFNDHDWAPDWLGERSGALLSPPLWQASCPARSCAARAAPRCVVGGGPGAQVPAALLLSATRPPPAALNLERYGVTNLVVERIKGDPRRWAGPALWHQRAAAHRLQGAPMLRHPLVGPLRPQPLRPQAAYAFFVFAYRRAAKFLLTFLPAAAPT